MTAVAHPSRRRVSLSALASVLLTGVLMAGSGPAAMAQDDPEPELTWAPLVTMQPIAPPPVATPTDLADGYRLGAADAPVALEVWEDFQCPFCQRFTFQIEPQIVEQYVRPGKASLTFRDLAFLGDESQWAAVAASLAADQGKFWPFHDYLFGNLMGENVGSYSLDRLLAIGEAVGLDMDQFRAGLTLDKARERYAQIEAEARQDAGALGIDSTPSLVLDGKLLQFESFDEAIAAIDAAVAAAGAAEASPGTSASAAPAGAPADDGAAASSAPEASPAA